MPCSNELGQYFSDLLLLIKAGVNILKGCQLTVCGGGCLILFSLSISGLLCTGQLSTDFQT